jgi:molybdenum cofactor cytidylyltransferase
MCWQQRPDRIVAAQYTGTTGAPAIFPSELFGELAALQGDRGARALLSLHADRVVAVPMPSAALDVDTPADLARA